MYHRKLLITLNQMAKNLVEEADDFVVDWQRQNWMYDGKRSLIQAIEKVSLTDVKHFYQELERVKNFGRFIIQLRGSRFKEEAFVQPQDVTNIKDIDFFHDKYKK
mgnify:CR=1 FL=1